MPRQYATGIYAPDIYDAAAPGGGSVRVAWGLAPTVSVASKIGPTVVVTGILK